MESKYELRKVSELSEGSAYRLYRDGAAVGRVYHLKDSESQNFDVVERIVKGYEASQKMLAMYLSK